jgi:uncharacterized membrane protein
MSAYLLLKTVHVLSATILFGTGLGTAFQMWMAHRSGDVRTIAVVARNVVRADLYFTTPAVLVQPLSGAVMLHLAGYSAFVPWLDAVYVLFLVTGFCWLPVVWIQMRVRDLAAKSVAFDLALPAEYFRLMRLWFWLGWPAFLSVTAIVWLMVAKPDL